MKTYTLTLLFSFLSFISCGQFVHHYGFYLQRNAATQNVKNPQNLRDVVFTWDPVYTWGAGIYAVRLLGLGQSIKGRIAYTPKGFRDDYTLNGIRLVNNRNILHYVSFEGLFQKNWGGGFTRPFLAGGLGMNVLVHKKVEDVFNTINGIPHISPDNYHALGMSGIFNLGANMGKFLVLEAGLSIDIRPALNQANASVRNWLGSLAVGVNLSEFIKK